MLFHTHLDLARDICVCSLLETGKPNSKTLSGDWVPLRGLTLDVRVSKVRKSNRKNSFLRACRILLSLVLMGHALAVTCVWLFG